VGLSGEVRSVSMARQRVAEAAKFGFKQCILPQGCARDAGGVLGAAHAVDSLTRALEFGMEAY